MKKYKVVLDRKREALFDSFADAKAFKQINKDAVLYYFTGQIWVVYGES